MKFQTRSIALILMSFLFFSVTALAQANNSCASAALITPDSACVTGTSQLTAQTLTGATYVAAELGTTTSACTFVAAPDVWYRFVARTKYPTITISGLGGGWGTSLKLQLLQGTCNAFTEIACANNAPMTPALTSPLTPGTTYYIRVHRNNTTSPGPANLGFTICVTDPLTKGSRMNEIFSRTTLGSFANYPWEVTYGSDDSLWITESKGYKVYKMSANTGVKRTVLDITQGSTFLPLADRTFNCQFNNGSGAQGGLAGLAIHPKFLDPVTPKNYVYISYIYSQTSSTVFTNRLVRFTYNTTTGQLGSPVSLCDTIPGSSDHNSQRITIAPVGSTSYLFYAAGDMGGGQFGNVNRPVKAQYINSYEGKILRFNLEPDGDPVTNYLDPWIPSGVNANPFNAVLGVQSAVWSTGMRNNQGFAYDSTLNILYGASHGPFSDDEINVIESGKNYGHPLVEGFAVDNNMNGTKAGAAPNMSPPDNPSAGCPLVVNEANNAATIGASYKDPLFSAYTTPAASSGWATVSALWNSTNGSNGNWPTESWSGLDLYSKKIIPGWNRSLLAGALKWGRFVRLKLGATGNTTLPSDLAYGNTGDTITYLQSGNRYRDLAFAPNGKDIFVIMDNNAATSGPGVGNPTTPACPGCVVKYSFLGYQAAAAAPGVSLIPKSVAVTNGVANTCNDGTVITIDGSNNFLWVPITGPDGNIMAEINAMGQNLGVVTSSFFKKSPGALRTEGGKAYLDRNITITPTINGPYATNVKVRLYISKTEFDDLVNDATTSLTNINQLKVYKNTDACSPYMTTNPAIQLTPTNTLAADLAHGANGYVVQVDVPSFSSFYFTEVNALLPLDLTTFTGSLQNNTTTLLKWKTENEINTSHFVVERSIDGTNFNSIGSVAAGGNTNTIRNYSFEDAEVAKQNAQIVYYRLKVTDINTAFKYSNIINVSLPTTKDAITVSPNPASNELKAAITSPVTGNAVWQIIDNAGRIIMYSSTPLKKGNNNISIKINHLAAGSYYLYISGQDIDMKTKFQKL